MLDTTLYDIGSVLLVTLVVGFTLACVLRRLRRTRPELRVGTAVGVGLGLRLVAVAGVSLSGLGSTLRGGDEATFVGAAREIAESSFTSSAWLLSESRRLHELVFAVQIRLGDFPEMALRVTQIGIAMLGMLLVLAAIHDIAGPRAASIGAWVLALEPSGVFFHSILHREPLLVLASGLVIFGGSKVWARLDARGLALLALGCAIATATRPYAGWFLIAGGLLLTLHAALCQIGTGLRSLTLVYAVAIVVALAGPAVLALTSRNSLEERLQGAQDANTAASVARGEANSSNLRLEPVDFSTRSDLVRNLPRRTRDLILRPYPWQTENTSQRLGAVGTLIVLAMLYLLVRYARRNRGRVLAITAPIFYPGICLLLAYAFSVGNAGTGFRYRTHLVFIGLVALVVLREYALRANAVQAGQRTGKPIEDIGAVGHRIGGLRGMAPSGVIRSGTRPSGYRRKSQQS